MPPTPRRLFICYSREDRVFRGQLETHLATLKAQRLLDSWSDVLPGEEFGPAISSRLEAADLVLLLVSARFMASKYVQEIELPRALDLHRQGRTRVVPVVVRKVDLEGTVLADLHTLPEGGKPVRSWTDRDAAWLSVVKGLRRVLEAPGPPPPPADLPQPWIPPLWRAWVERTFTSLEPQLDANRVNHFKTLDVYVPLRAAWLSPALCRRRRPVDPR